MQEEMTMKNIMLDLLIEDFSPDTEFDDLLDIFEQIIPPSNFVEQLMQKVSCLPLPTLPRIPWSHLSDLHVEVDPLSLS
jgi:hypothetical protein